MNGAIPTSAVFWVSYGVLWLIAITQMILILALARAYSRRLDATLEGRSEKHGPAIGDVAPDLAGPTLRDPPVSQSLPKLVIFMDAGCTPCEEARPIVSWFAQRYGHGVQVVVNCGGKIDDVEHFSSALDGPIRVVADIDGANAAAWRVKMSPFAALVDDMGRVRAKRARVALQDLEVPLKTRSQIPLELEDRPAQVRV